MQPPNHPTAIANVTQLALDLIRALDGYAGGTVSPDAVDDRGATPVTVRQALVAVRERIDGFLE